MPGCGMATRQTRAFEPFTYLDPEVAREITRRYIGAFSSATCSGAPVPSSTRRGRAPS